MQLSIPEINFDPVGNDEMVIAAIEGEERDLLASVISTGLCRAVLCNDDEKRRSLLRLIAAKIVEEADGPGRGAG